MKRSVGRNQARTLGKIFLGDSKNAMPPTDRVEKSDTFEMLIRKNLPGATVVRREFISRYNRSSDPRVVARSDWR